MNALTILATVIGEVATALAIAIVFGIWRTIKKRWRRRRLGIYSGWIDFPTD